MNILSQTLSLNGLRFYAYHGVEPQERVVGAWYTVNLEMKIDVAPATVSDSLAHTLNYARATEIVSSVMRVPSNLIEHVAGRIADSLMDEFPLLETLRVTVAKQNPPVCAVCSSAQFTLSVSRG